jgi:four helix bundle protein
MEVEVPIERSRQWTVWLWAHRLAVTVYKTAQGLPRDQRFGLIDQMHTAAQMVPANIAEGFKRRGQADKVQFYTIAQAFLEELRSRIILCRDLEYKIDYESMVEQSERVGRMLTGLINSLKV